MAPTLRFVLCCLPLIVFHWMLVVPVARGKSRGYDFDVVIENSTNAQPIQANETVEIRQKEGTNRSFEQSGVAPTKKIHRLVLISILVQSKSNHTSSGHTSRSAKKILFRKSRSLRRKRSEDRYRSEDANVRSGGKSSRYLDSVNGGQSYHSTSGNRGTSDLSNFDPYEQLFLTADQRAALLDTVTDTQRSGSSKSVTGYESHRNDNRGSYHDYNTGYRNNYQDEDRYRNKDTYHTDTHNNDYSRKTNDGSYYGANDRYTYQTDTYRTESNHNLYYNRENARSDGQYSYNNYNGGDYHYNDRNYRDGQSRSNNGDRYSSRVDSYTSRYNDKYYRNDHNYGNSNSGRVSNINDYQSKDKSRNEYTSYYDRYNDNSLDKNRDTKYDQSHYNDNRYDSNRSRYTDSSTDHYRNHYNSYTNGATDNRRNSDTKQDVGDRYSSLYDDSRSSNSHYDRYYDRDTDRGNTGRSQYDTYRHTGSDSHNQDSYWKQHEQKPAYPDTLFSELSLPSSNHRFQDYSSDDYRSSSSGSGNRETSYTDGQHDRQHGGYYNDHYSYGDSTHSSSGNSGVKRDYKRSYKHESASSRQYLDANFPNNTEQGGGNGSQESPRKQLYLEAFNIYYDRVPYNISENRSFEYKKSTSGYGQYELPKQRDLYNIKSRFKRQAPEQGTGGYQFNAGYYNQPQFHNSFQNGQSNSRQGLSYPSQSVDSRYAPYLRSRSHSEQNPQPDYSMYQNAYHINQQPYENHYDQRAYYGSGSFNNQNPYGRAEYANYETSGHERSLTPYNTPSTYQPAPHQSNRYQTFPSEPRYSAYQNSEYSPYSHSIGSYGDQAENRGGYGSLNGNFPKQSIAHTSQPLLQPHQQQGQEYYPPGYDNSQHGLYNSPERGGFSPYDQSQGSNYGTYDQRQVAYNPYTPGGQDNPYARSSYQAQQNFPGSQGYQGRQNSEYSPYSYAR